MTTNTDRLYIHNVPEGHRPGRTQQGAPPMTLPICTRCGGNIQPGYEVQRGKMRRLDEDRELYVFVDELTSSKEAPANPD